MNVQIWAEEMQGLLSKLFAKYGFSDESAGILAAVTTENTLNGVNSHGINRVPLFIEYVEKGIVKVDLSAEQTETFGCIERWDGKQGAGILNAQRCAERAVSLAKMHGMGLVALRNTNHWMRGGAYGWQAANEGCIAIMFTNTKPNMPPWGGMDSRIGNNPLVVAIPREKGHVVLDMSMSHFAFGKINEYRLKGERLPFPGGWDADDQLSDDPDKILFKERGLPIGYWKGSALSMVLDMLATLLSAGNATCHIGSGNFETGISQVFLCIDPSIYREPDLQQKLLDEIIAFVHDVPPMQPGGRTFYPGERALQNKRYNLENGMQVDRDVWQEVLNLAQ